MNGVPFNLVTPGPVRLGIFQVDLLEKALGVSLADILAPMLVRPPEARQAANGKALRVYPLHLPPGEGVDLTLQPWGSLGLAADRDLLRFSCPLAAAPLILPSLLPHVHEGPVRNNDGETFVWLKLRPGARVAIPLGPLGEVAIEAA